MTRLQDHGHTISSTVFGATPEGRAVELFALRHRDGMEVEIMTYGGIVRSLTAADRHGNWADVVLGYDGLEGYISDRAYLGALIGRYANRIAGGRFNLDGIDYRLSINDPPNALHGGQKGFNKVIWKVTGSRPTLPGPQLSLMHESPDGEEGYPGALKVSAVYTLTEDALQLEYAATSDKTTIVNLTQHSYFNLRGGGDILGHIVRIDADRFTPIDATQIPTGEICPVDDTVFDFRTPTSIGARIDTDVQQLTNARGYDQNWVTDGPSGVLRPVAKICEPETGRVLEVLSNQPGLQFYSGNFLDGSIRGKAGHIYHYRSGLCFEPQHFPDSPNHRNFPSTVLEVGETYRSTIIYRLSTE